MVEKSCTHEEALIQDYEADLSRLPESSPEAVAIQNKIAAIYLKLRQVKECAKHCRKALSVDPSSVEARACLARALLASGDLRSAREVLTEIETVDDEGEIQKVEKEVQAAEAQLCDGDTLLEARDFKGALEKFGALEGGAIFDCPSLVARMGRCYLGLGDTNRVLNVSAGLLRQDPGDVEAHLLRAEARFQATKEHIDTEAWDKQAEVAMKLTRQALSLDPENRKAAQLWKRLKGHMALVKEVRSFMAGGRHDRAEELLTGILTATSNAACGKFAARCHAERARARLERGDLDGSIADCREAARLDNRLTVAPVVEAQALQKQERWDDAVTVLEALCEWNKDNDIFWKKEWAIFEVRRVRRPNFYEILGIDQACQLSEVKKAYLRLSAEYHPDKICKKNPNVDPYEAEAKFKAIAEAYEFVGDRQKRELYDKGYDAQGIREVLAVRKRHAGQAPCSICGEDEVGKIGSDGKWYCLRCWDSYYRDKPEEDLGTTPGVPGSSSSSSAASPGPTRTNGSSSQPQTDFCPAGSTPPKPEDVDRMGVTELKTLLAKMKVEARGCLTKDDLRAFVRERVEEMWRSQPQSPQPSDAVEEPELRPRGHNSQSCNPASAPSQVTASAHSQVAPCRPQSVPLQAAFPTPPATEPAAGGPPERRTMLQNGLDWSFSMTPGRPLTTADAWTLGVGRGVCAGLGGVGPLRLPEPGEGPSASVVTMASATTSVVQGKAPALTKANYEHVTFEYVD